jgi:hypothetical protein
VSDLFLGYLTTLNYGNELLDDYEDELKWNAEGSIRDFFQVFIPAFIWRD